MKLLAIETSSIVCSVALLDESREADAISQGQMGLLHQIAPMQQAKLILPMINELLQSFSLSLKQLDGIAYGSGPGSFTGTRLAYSVSQAIAFAENLPIIAVSSLAAIAQAAFMDHQEEHFLVALDTCAQQIHWAIYTVKERNFVEKIGKEEIYHPSQIAIPSFSRSQEKKWSGVGNGWEKYQKELVAALGFTPSLIIPSQLPRADAVLYLAKNKITSDSVRKREVCMSLGYEPSLKMT